MIKGLKTKLGLALASTALGATLVAGGSFAYFTSQAESTSNEFQAGTLTIALNAATPWSGNFNINNWAPGDSAEQEVTIRNTGSLPLKYDLVLTPTGDLAGAIKLEAFEKTGKKEQLHMSGRSLASGAQETVIIKATFNSEAGNNYQNKSGGAHIQVNATQTR